MKQLEKRLRLELNSGEVTEVTVPSGISIKAYFTSLSILNRISHTYGSIYLATDEALGLLEEMK